MKYYLIMQVLGVSVDKTSYVPGEAITLNIIVQWGVLDTGGVVFIQGRGDGETFWKTLATHNVGDPGLGIPNIGMAGKTQVVPVTLVAPDSAGYYQIGAREQSQSVIPDGAAATIHTIPVTPSIISGNGTVHVTTNRDDTGDAVLFIDGSPMTQLPASGYYVDLPEGQHVLSAAGSQYSASGIVVDVIAGEVKTVVLPLVSTGSSLEGWAPVALAAGVGLVGGLVCLYYITSKED